MRSKGEAQSIKIPRTVALRIHGEDALLGVPYGDVTTVYTPPQTLTCKALEQRVNGPPSTCSHIREQLAIHVRKRLGEVLTNRN
jgi:hypothetical protein